MAGSFCLVRFFSFIILSLIYSTLSNSSEGKVKELNDDNWREMLEGEWMVKFYAPWCPACRDAIPVWSAFAVKAKQLGVGVGDVDVTKQAALSGRFMVTRLPTIYHVKDGQFRKYEGYRSLEDIEAFVTEEKWRQVDPIPSWKSPGSFLMGVLGILFKLSILLKNTHDMLTVTYGLPAWASYAVFGVSTVGAGLLLGVLLVFASDFVFSGPARKPVRVESAVPQAGKDEGIENTPENDERESDEEHENEEKHPEGSVRKRTVPAKTD